MTLPGATATSPWAPSRQRAEALRERQPFAAEVLGLYLALLDVWEQAWQDAREQRPRPPALADWAAGRVVPRVVEATANAGPEPLAAATRELAADGAAARPALAAWLAGEELPPVDRYLARAALRGPLQALDPDAACAADPTPRGGRRCPRCGGPPQLSFRTHSDEALVSGRRRLACARCGAGWGYTGSACPSCGETAGARRTVYAERRERPAVGRHQHATAGAGGPTFPHLRIEGCDRCGRYLIDVDLSHDARAVPEVDELAALPLDLHAAELGLSKVTPNLMGF